MTGTTDPIILLIRSALQIADQAILCDIECEGTAVGERSERRFDVSALFNPNERPPELIDMAEQGIAYGLARGLIELDPQHKHTVRIVRSLRMGMQ